MIMFRQAVISYRSIFLEFVVPNVVLTGIRYKKYLIGRIESKERKGFCYFTIFCFRSYPLGNGGPAHYGQSVSLRLRGILFSKKTPFFLVGLKKIAYKENSAELEKKHIKKIIANIFTRNEYSREMKKFYLTNL
jgi:hypothetical protein